MDYSRGGKREYTPSTYFCTHNFKVQNKPIFKCQKYLFFVPAPYSLHNLPGETYHFWICLNMKLDISLNTM